MPSIRRRLTVGYTIALATTIVGFGVILYIDRRQSSIRELDARIELESDLSVRYLGESYRVLGHLVDTTGQTPALDAPIASYFDNIRDYLMVLDRKGRMLFASDRVAALNFPALEQLRLNVGKERTLQIGTMTFDQAIGPVRYRIVPVGRAGPQIGTVFVAAGVTDVAFGPSGLLRSMLVIAPFLFIASVLLGYSVAGASLRPLDAMIEELTAITDGRSLHRRLPVDPGTSDELSRLGHAVNGMFARLEQSFAAQQRFVADASHELKTPLMVLRAGVERALTNPNAPPESLQALDESLEEVNRMTELVESLLTLARADEGRAALVVESCDLRELVSEAAETAEMLAEQSGIVVRTQIPPQPVLLQVDRNRIRQLLLNLSTNAVKYTNPGGEVAIGLTDSGAAVELVVRDTGIGIAPGDLPHIFDRFWRADPARTRESERAGVGLGLAITKWIAEAHGGSIVVQSRPGRGTIFTVTLPRGHNAASVS
jgi:heavy metal sensor kinase